MLPFLTSAALSMGLLLLGPGASAATIADLVAEVSTAQLQGHVSALEGDRASTAGRNAARSYIEGQLQSYGYATSVDAFGNVVAELGGATTPDEIYVVGAHFDSVFGTPGADDNASGIAGMLETARVFSTQSFDSTIRFVGFDLEEIGLVGSTAYAQAASAAGEDIALAAIFEMIGYTSATQIPLPSIDLGSLGSLTVSEVRSIGDFLGVLGANDPQLTAAFLAAAGIHAPSLRVVTGDLAADVNDPLVQSTFGDLFRSDHVGFWLEGYAALMLTDTANFRNPNYHTAADTSSTLDDAFMTGVVQGSVGFLAGEAGLIVPEPALPLLLGVALLGCAAQRRGRGRRRA